MAKLTPAEEGIQALREEMADRAMARRNGTPKTMGEALRNAMALELSSVGTVAALEVHVRDFLAQRFGAAMMQHPEAEGVLRELFDGIVKKEAA